MTAGELLARLRASGFSMQADGARLTVIPGSRLTDSDRQAIRAHKAELLHIVAGTVPERGPESPLQATRAPGEGKHLPMFARSATGPGLVAFGRAAPGCYGCARVGRGGTCTEPVRAGLSQAFVLTWAPSTHRCSLHSEAPPSSESSSATQAARAL